MAWKLQRDQSANLLSVKRGDEYCGYRWEYLAQNPLERKERLACGRCFGIMREASFSQGKPTCLVCRETPKIVNPVIGVQQSIRSLNIRCPLLRDCDWKGKMSEAETHLENCLFFLIQCKECEQIFPRRVREEHESNSCPKRTIYCDYCEMGGKAEDKEIHLIKFCDEYLIFCPNECGVELSRKELLKHRSGCELEMVTCPYTEYGCKANSMLRRDLLTHKKELYIEHLDMSLVEIKQLKKENISLKKERNEMKCIGMSMKQLDGVDWKTIDELEDGEETEGPSFYINNYKLRICCILQRDRFWKYLSFYLKRIEGKFDKNLGKSYITHYRVIEVDEQDYSESDYTEGILNYQLKIGRKSDVIWGNHSTTEQYLLRFYFEVNSKPLSSSDLVYPKKDHLPFITHCSLEEDPWGYFVT